MEKVVAYVVTGRYSPCGKYVNQLSDGEMPSAWKVTLHIDKTKKWITSSEEYLNKVEGKKEYNGVKVYGLDDWKDWEYDLAIMLDQCPCAF